MKEKFAEHDVVKVKRDIETKRNIHRNSILIKKGTEGVIVSVYFGRLAYAVEFSNGEVEVMWESELEKV